MKSGIKKFVLVVGLILTTSVVFADDNGGGGSNEGSSGSESVGSSTVSVNDNTNLNTQGQQQSQSQVVNSNSHSSSNSSVKNSGNSSSTASGGTVSGSGNSNNTNNQSTNANGNGSNNSLSTGASTSSADGAGTNNGNGSNNTQITYQNYRQPVTTAFASSLTSGIDTCLGSASGGVQTQILGLSLGGTKVDENCVLLKQVQLLQQMGMSEAACFRARQGVEGKSIDDAMVAAGVDCKSLTKPVAALVATPSVVVPTTTIFKETDAVTHEELNNTIKKALQK